MKIAGKLAEIFFTSLVFSFVVGLLLLNAEKAAETRSDALELLSRADYVARAGLTPDIRWTTARRADAGVAMDSALVNLRASLPGNVFKCLADVVAQAKETAFQTHPDLAGSIRLMEARFATTREIVEDWHWAKTYALGLQWSENEREC